MYKQVLAWSDGQGSLYRDKKEAIKAAFLSHIANIRAHLLGLEGARDQVGILELIAEEAQCALEDLEALEEEDTR